MQKARGITINSSIDESRNKGKDTRNKYNSKIFVVPSEAIVSLESCYYDPLVRS